MRLLKIAAVNVRATVGAVHANADRLLTLASAMLAEEVTLAAFPEQVLGGYPAEDLVQWRAYVAAQRGELERFAAATADHRTVYVVGLVVAADGQLFNVAAVVHGGRILGFVPKEKLPTYNVFYEARTLSRGARGLALDAAGVPLGDQLFAFDFGVIGVEVCEDIWTPDGPMRRRCFAGAELIINISASPYRVGVQATRREMLATRSADNEATLLYTNLVGGQDGLIFDGGGFVFQSGRPILEAARFRHGYTTAVVDLDRTLRLRTENTTWRSDWMQAHAIAAPVPIIRSAATTADPSRLTYPVPEGNSFFLPVDRLPPRTPREEVLDELFEALAMGVRDYFEKTGAFRRIGVALSGGRDSLLALLVAWRAAQMLRADGAGALPPEEGSIVTAVYMPTRYSRPETRIAAERICRELDVPLIVSSIDEAFEREVEANRALLEGADPAPVTLQNIQARLRGARMWNWSNSVGALFLQTSDMSEKAIGYTTIGGDLEGGLSVITNVPKTVVIAMLERLHARFAFQGIALTLATVPGPELAEAQEAEAELMPFPILDACLHLYAGEKLAPHEVAAALVPLFPDIEPERLRAYTEQFARGFTQSIYKWVQSPLSLHVGSLDLERERALQLPVVQRNEWW